MTFYPDTFRVLHDKAMRAVRALADYAHSNETLEDAYGESKPAMDAAEYNRVKAEQGFTAIRDMTIGKPRST